MLPEPPGEMKKWGSIKILEHEKDDALLEELKMMTLISCEVVKVNNLVIDLEIKNFKSIPCPLVAY